MPFASMVVGVVRRLISMPMKAKGAQHVRAQGMPQMETRMVAIWRERTKGARHMLPAKRRWEYCHVVRRSGM